MLPWMNWMGLLISWAMPATSRPSEACFSVWTSCICFSERLVSASSSCRSRDPQPSHDGAGDGHRGATWSRAASRASTARNGAWAPATAGDAGEGLRWAGPTPHSSTISVRNNPKAPAPIDPRRAPREEHHAGVGVDEVEADERARAAAHEVEEDGEGDEVEADLQARLDRPGGGDGRPRTGGGRGGTRRRERCRMR